MGFIYIDIVFWCFHSLTHSLTHSAVWICSFLVFHFCFLLPPPALRRNVHYPKIPNRTVHPLASIGFANINFAGEPLPSSLGTFVRRFECTNCSLSGSLPRGIMSSVGCPYDHAIYSDYNSKCDSETNVCSPEVCAERDSFSDDPVDYGRDDLDFGVYLTGNDFNDVLTYDDVVRCSSGMPGSGDIKKWSQQINCLFEGSKISFPREQATFHGPKKLPAPLLLSSFGIVGDLPSWLFESCVRSLFAHSVVEIPVGRP